MKSTAAFLVLFGLFLPNNIDPAQASIPADKIYKETPEGKIHLPKTEKEAWRDVCKEEAIDCGPGRQCSQNEKGEPKCICIEECSSHHQRSVCGSNGQTYKSHCHLHQAACVEEIKLSIDYPGQCKEKPTEPSEAKKPDEEGKENLVVCLEEQRERLRKYLIEWLKSEEISEGWFFGGRSYHKILQEYFQEFDLGHDSELDSNEFLMLTETNGTIMNIYNDTDGVETPLLKALCIDALIDSTDDDHDWKLSFKEFAKCLDPHFHPSHKSCSLEDEDYKDGENTHVKCNLCICACGNWVCTSKECEESKVKRPEFQIVEEKEYFDEDDEEVMTENEWEEYIRQLYVKDGESDEIVPHKEEKEHIQDKKHFVNKEFEKSDKKENGLKSKKEPFMEEKLFSNEKNVEKESGKYVLEDHFELSEEPLDKLQDYIIETRFEKHSKDIGEADQQKLKTDEKVLENIQSVFENDKKETVKVP